MHEFTVKTETELINVLKALHFGGGGRIKFDGEILLTQTHKMTVPISLEGLPNSLIKVAPGVSTAFYYTGTSVSTHSLKVDLVNDRVETSAKLNRGDHVILRADDKLAVTPHYLYNAGAYNAPSEIHQVNYVDTKNNLTYFNTKVIDQFLDNPMLYTLKPIKGIVIKDLTMEFDGTGQSNYAAALNLTKCVDVVIENVKLNRNGAGGINIFDCYNVKIHGLVIDGTEAVDSVYGVVAGVTNNVLITDTIISGCRHAFTTTAGYTKEYVRYGTPQNIKLSNCIINVPAKENGIPRVGLDTHAEGYGIVFENCLVNVSHDTSHIGCQTRSRNTVFKNIIVRGGSRVRAMQTYGPNTTYDGCIVDGAWIGICVRSFRGFDNSNYATINNCILQNIGTSPILLEKGDYHVVKGCIGVGGKFEKNGEPLVKYTGTNVKVLS